MDVQLACDGADAPAFGVVIAQDLRFNLGGKGHVTVISCRFVENGKSDDAGSPGAPSPARDTGNGDRSRALI